jgi:hypothetical protein
MRVPPPPATLLVALAVLTVSLAFSLALNEVEDDRRLWHAEAISKGVI